MSIFRKKKSRVEESFLNTFDIGSDHNIYKIYTYQELSLENEKLQAI